MIPTNFVYIRPDYLSQVAIAYTQMEKEGRAPVYYGGGTEIITMARAGSRCPGAVIDLKSIPECNALELTKDRLTIGSAVTLYTIKESGLFPLLGTACGRVSDHTNQCRITLGGNICGSIIYRETSLPLMLSDAEATLYGPEGARRCAFNEVFNRRMQLKPGEFLVQVHVPAWALKLPYSYIKKTTQDKIDYPLVNVTALRSGDGIRVAFSGLCAYPFRSPKIERILNDRLLSPKARINMVLSMLSKQSHTDAEGSAEYRLFVLKNTLEGLLEEWK